MEVIVMPASEDDVLTPVMQQASAEEVLESLITKAECCVVHLCGCSKCC